MSRRHRLKERAGRTSWLMARRELPELLVKGYVVTEVFWRRPLPRGLWLPFWNGAPLISMPMPKPAARPRTK